MLHNGEVITAFGAILDAVSARIHGALEAFDKDCVTLSLFTSILADVERFAWMLRAQSDRKDSATSARWPLKMGMTPTTKRSVHG